MHVLIAGVTGTGKTTLAHELSQRFAREGHRVIVYDPVLTKTAAGTWPDSAVLFDEQDAFFEYLSRPDVHSAHVFVDEAGEVFSIGQRENFWVLTRGRHYNLHVYMIVQRPKMIAPSARTQARRGYIFRLSPDDMDDIGADFGFSGVGKIVLDKGQFLVLDTGTVCIKRASIF